MCLWEWSSSFCRCFCRRCYCCCCFCCCCCWDGGGEGWCCVCILKCSWHMVRCWAPEECQIECGHSRLLVLDHWWLWPVYNMYLVEWIRCCLVIGRIILLFDLYWTIDCILFFVFGCVVYLFAFVDMFYFRGWRICLSVYVLLDFVGYRFVREYLLGRIAVDDWIQ